MRKAGIFVLIFLCSIPLVAHDLFLRSRPFILPGPGSVVLSMWLAEAFPGKEQKWRADKTVSAAVNGSTGYRKLNVTGTAPEIPLNQAGTFVIGWESRPSYIKIDAAAFAIYLEADGYMNVIEIRKKRGEESKEGTERYVRYLKALVQVGSQRTEHYKDPFGFKIELIPSSNPYSTKIGGPLELQLFFDGKPLVGAKVLATYEGFSEEHDVYAQSLQSGPDGKFKVIIDHPGLWMVRANYMLPLAGDSKAEWESFWANLTFEIPG